jgi:PAS domain S-box-containing protein
MLCVMDSEPRTLGPQQRRALQQLSDVVAGLLLAHRRNVELRESQALVAKTEALRASHLTATNFFLDSMVEHIPTAVYIKDAESLRYVKVNRAAEEMLGMTREQLLGKSAADLFGQPEADSLEAQDRRVIASQDVVDVPEQNIPWRGQTTRTIHTRKAPVVNAQGVMTHILGIAEDVTHQRQLQQQVLDLNAVLQARAEDLEFTNKSLEGFAAATTHDLRSPLSVIGGYAGLLEKTYGPQLDEKARHYLSVIRARTSSMAALIDDLLAFARLGSKEVCKTTVDNQQLVSEITAELMQAHPGPQPSIRLSALPTAQADPALLRQVWMNLLSNALKYSRKAQSPQIEISGRSEGAEVIYSVRDNGAGFDMAAYDKLFEVFERLHSDDEFEGTGVGLPIVQRIVTRHGGRVWAEGRVGEGAVFYFSLPVTVAVAPVAHAPAH